MNKGVKTSAESVERRTLAKRNPRVDPVVRTQSLTESEMGLERVGEAAMDRTVRFNNLLHHVTVNQLRRAYLELKRKAAPGVDGETWQSYGQGLEEKLAELHRRIHTGGYRAQPVKRVWIPKADGRKRPIGITNVQDKVVQQALVRVLEVIYEKDFLGFSYGFRPGRSQHGALDALYMALTTRKVSWVLDADIEGFFDHIDHTWLKRFLRHRIADPRVLRLIEQMLTAGVIDEGQWQGTQRGVPQGAVISPLLANIYLHYVLDQWVHAWRVDHARGEVYVVRYADDFVVGLQYQEDGERLMAELQDRLARFGLRLHSRKTRLIEFGRFAALNRAERGADKPASFDFLGFTHLCGRTRKGRFTVHRRSHAGRQRELLQKIKGWLKRNACIPTGHQGHWLQQVARGYFQYHSVPGNQDALQRFRREVNRYWLRTLRRRSQIHRLPWNRMQCLVKRWIPDVRILHPYPSERFAY
jgi:RNA-directed DNA polymerase